MRSVLFFYLMITFGMCFKTCQTLFQIFLPFLETASYTITPRYRSFYLQQLGISKMIYRPFSHPNPTLQFIIHKAGKRPDIAIKIIDKIWETIDKPVNRTVNLTVAEFQNPELWVVAGGSIYCQCHFNDEKIHMLPLPIASALEHMEGKRDRYTACWMDTMPVLYKCNVYILTANTQMWQWNHTCEMEISKKTAISSRCAELIVLARQYD